MKKCNKCGGELCFSSEKQNLVCTNCNEEISIQADDSIGKRSLQKQLQIEQPNFQGDTLLHCDSCGAESTFDKDFISEKCSYCGSNLINKNTAKFNFPDNIIPFEISKEESKTIFKTWIQKLWFAPNALKHLINSMNELNGCYVPFWAFDANSDTDYSGERGDYYYETTIKIVNGTKQEIKERKTKWKNVSGSVSRSFRNKLELAQTILPESLVDDLGSWNLSKSKKFNKDFTLGYQSLFSNIKVDNAWSKFIDYAHDQIEDKIKDDIGGDEQRIYSKNVNFYDRKSVQISAPIWIGTYKFNQKTYRVCINGENGQVDAERPFSIAKITSLTLGVISTISATILYFNPEYLEQIKTFLNMTS